MTNAEKDFGLEVAAAVSKLAEVLAKHGHTLSRVEVTRKATPPLKVETVTGSVDVCGPCIDWMSYNQQPFGMGNSR